MKKTLLFSLAQILALSLVVVPTFAQTDATGTIPAGASFDAKLQEDISSAKNHNQDRFTLREQNPLFGGNPLLKDAQVEGHLEQVIKAAKGAKARLHLVFDDIVLKDGSRLPLDVALVNSNIETKTKGTFLRNAGIVIGGAVIGHYVGKAAHVPLGTTGGAATATAVVLNSPGGEVVLKRGTTLKLKLNTPLSPGTAAQ